MIQKKKLVQFYLEQYEQAGKKRPKRSISTAEMQKRVQTLFRTLRSAKPGRVNVRLLEDYHRQLKNISVYAHRKNRADILKKLQEEVAQLTEENNRLVSDQFELRRLRELYNLDQEYLQYEKTAARVIAKDSGDWFQVFRVDKGSADGVEVGSNVMAGGGLVGIVTDVGAHYATVRSIIDDSSRVSSMAVQSGDTCIVAGDLTLYEEGRLRITNIQKDADVKEGDRIVTSNISSKFLPGILIGYASDITLDSNQLTSSGYLVPVVSFRNLQEVLIITQVKETGDQVGQ